MKANLETYLMDNGKYGVFVEIETSEVPVVYADKCNADTEFEALQKTITDGIFAQLLT